MYDLRTADFITTEREEVPTGADYCIRLGLDGVFRYFVWIN